MSDQVLTVVEARKLARLLLAEGKIRYSGHALLEMENDGLEQEEVERALRGGCEEPEWENGQWRYRFHSYGVWAVVIFRDEELLVVITAWRIQR